MIGGWAAFYHTDLKVKRCNAREPLALIVRPSFLASDMSKKCTLI